MQNANDSKENSNFRLISVFALLCFFPQTSGTFGENTDDKKIRTCVFLPFGISIYLV